jgi:hypothetical protein
LPPTRQIVFDGNAPAPVENNRPLAALLESPTWSSDARAVPAWIGEPVTIKEEGTAPVFRCQAGSNLLIAGQDEALALQTLVCAAISLAAHFRPPRAAGTGPPALFYVVDLAPADNPFFGRLKKDLSVLPHDRRFVERREVPSLLGQVAKEVRRRHSRGEGVSDDPVLFILIHGLQRVRDLREDDYHREDDSFGEEGNPDPPPPHGHPFGRSSATGRTSASTRSCGAIQ